MRCIALSFMLLVLFARVNEGVHVKLEEATFVGKKLYSTFEKKPYGAFWKIPYAESPLRELRFKSPKAKLWYNETYDYSINQDDNCKCGYKYDEDRLFLSIYMPISRNKSRNFPVIVWIIDTFELLTPDFSVEEDIVVVVVTYRTSIFGFLNTGDEFAEGNMGAKDIIMALKWVKKHIAFFEGDPKRVTVAGLGTSATIVASLSLIPTGVELFKRKIVISGSALTPGNYGRFNFEILNKLYRNLHGTFEKFNRNDLYEIFSKSSTTKLLEASQEIFDSTEIRDGQRLLNAFGPCIVNSNNAYINKSFLEFYKKQLTNNNIEAMFGYTSLESLYKLQGFVKNKKLLKYLNYNFQYLLPFEGTKDEYGSERYNTIRNKIMEFYFVNGTIGERSLRRYAKYVSDQLIYPLLRQARLHAEVTRSKVFVYRFSFKGALNVGWKSSLGSLDWSGATSGDETCYLFRCKSVKDLYNSVEASNERHFIKKIARLLANFAKFGYPTTEADDPILNDVKWESLSSTKRIRVMNLGQKFKMVNAPEEARVKFWDQLKSEFFPEKPHKDEL